MSNSNFILSLPRCKKPLDWSFFTTAATRVITEMQKPIPNKFACSNTAIGSLGLQKKQWANIFNCSSTKISGICWVESNGWSTEFPILMPADRQVLDYLLCLDAVPSSFYWGAAKDTQSVNLVATEIYMRLQAWMYEDADGGGYVRGHNAKVLKLVSSIKVRSEAKAVLTSEYPFPFDYAAHNHVINQALVPEQLEVSHAN